MRNIYLIIGSFLLSFICITNIVTANNRLFPNTTIYDVTKPELWGGNPSVKATPDDPTDDDALGINEAIKAAVKRIIEVDQNNYGVYQQIIFIPEGEYHLSSPVIIPTMPEVDKKENSIWIHGQGEENTIIKLKEAKETDVFGTPENPKPLLQYAVYTHGSEASGNTNFLLWATDFSIIIPGDQPNAIGISYGAANTGGVRNLKIKAEGEGGHTGFSLVQYNNGPGWVEHLTVEGFDTGIEISDGWGETFAFSDITLINQNKGGKGISITDKMIAIENLASIQDEPDVIPVYLFDDNSYNSGYGGAPHITILNSNIISKSPASVPAIQIDKGHSFIRDVKTSGYGEYVIRDHKKERYFLNGEILEYVSVHGKTDIEQDNVIYTLGEVPPRSLNLPIKTTPEIEPQVWGELDNGSFNIVSQEDLVEGQIRSNNAWLILDPSKSADDTKLLQAALNSGAKYIGLLNNEPFHISKNITVNENFGSVELILGHTSEIYIDSLLSNRQKQEIPNNQTLFTINTGSSEKLIIKGLHFTTPNRNQSDLLYFQNNSSKTVVFEDLSGKAAPKAYRNGTDSYGSDVFFENVMFAFSGIYMEEIVIIKNQNVWARQFNLEAPVVSYPVSVYGKQFSRYRTMPLLVNNGGRLWVFAQKLGEQNGIFVNTSDRGKTELLSVYFNSARSSYFMPPSKDATNFVIMGKGSELSLVGQERIRTKFDDNHEATETLPHGNTFGRIELNGVEKVIFGTELPTYLSYPGLNPFSDNDVNIYDKKNHFRVAGLIRVKSGMK